MKQILFSIVLAIANTSTAELIKYLFKRLDKHKDEENKQDEENRKQ